MTRMARLKRSVMMVVWRIVNPLNRRLTGIAPWWVLVETVGRRTGKPTTTPLARGPFDGEATWVISVHGRHASWVKNLEASPSVRLRLNRRWRRGIASVVPYDREIIRRFNRYARAGPATIGIDPVLIRIDLSP